MEAAEINYKIAELIGALADTKMELANIQEVLLEKEKTIKGLHDQYEIDARINYQEPYYYLLGDDKEKDGPFCQKCYDSNKKLIRLQSPNKNGWWMCNECRSTYQDANFEDSLGDSEASRGGGMDLTGY